MIHIPEPWARHYDSGVVVIRDAQGDVVICELEDAPRGSEDAERIVACVNFCRGIPLDWLKKRHLTLEPGFVALKVSDDQDRQAAESLKGTTVGVARGQFPPLPEGQHYLSDLLGSRVVNRTGEALGEVSGLRANEAAGVLRQWLEVSDGTDTRLIPLVEPYVDEVDAARKVIRVDWQRDW